jgi:hypothetical protein
MMVKTLRNGRTEASQLPGHVPRAESACPAARRSQKKHKSGNLLRIRPSMEGI